MEPLEKTESKIGVYVLESLTTGMYTNAFDSIREYIQNSLDSIVNAEKKGIIKANCGEIKFSASPQNREIVITDNGEGIPENEVASRLLNIGMSGKEIGQDAGFRGIGRLAGTAYCERLEFMTSHKGEKSVSTLTFDCRGLRQAISPAMKQTGELADVIEQYTTLNRGDAQADEHYFKVKMTAIIKNSGDFLDKKKISDYLQQVIPVDFNHKFIFSKLITESAQNQGISIPTVNLILEEPDTGFNHQIFKPYKANFTADKRSKIKDEITDIIFILDNENKYWGWYGKTQLYGGVTDEKIAGLRFRHKNILIGGPERTAEDIFPTNTNIRMNNYLIGEIYILNSDVIPNARRDGFEPNIAWDLIKENLRPYVQKEFVKKIRATSDNREKQIKKVVISADKIKMEAEDSLVSGISSKNHQSDLIDKIEKEEEKINTRLENIKENESDDRKLLNHKKEELLEVKRRVEDNSNFTGMNISRLDRKQRKLLNELLEITYNILNNNGCPKGQECVNQIKNEIYNKYHTAEETV